MHSTHVSRYGTILLATTCALAAVSCKKTADGGGRRQSAAAQWVDAPKAGSKTGTAITFDQLGVKFEIPDTLYVYRSCGEASHTPQGDNKWIPIVTCQSVSSTAASAPTSDEGEEDFSDFSSDEDDFDAGGELDTLSLTFYVTHKTRPIDERAVSWFENQYKQAGLEVEDVSYQHDYQKKAGIYAKMQVMNSASGVPTHEVMQFMFPRGDVVFIARVEYPFGDARGSSVMTDWKYLLWNFDIDPAE